MTKNYFSYHSLRLSTLLAILIISTTAVEINAQDSYAEYVKQYMSGLKKFKSERDSTFSVMLKQQWEVFEASQGRAPKQKPVPPEPYVISKPTIPVDFEIKVIPATPTVIVQEPKPTIAPPKQIIPTPKPVTPTPEKPIVSKKPTPKPEAPKPTPKPTAPVKPVEKPLVVPISTAPTPQITPSTPAPEITVDVPHTSVDSYGKGNCNIQFYGTNVNLPMSADMRFTLNNLSEKEISNAWDKLCATDFKKVIENCLDIKKALNLNDWLYVKLIIAISDKWENDRKNESNMLAMFLLLQSGYNVKVANCSGNLVLLYSTPNLIYAVDYLTIDGGCYYIIDKLNGNYSCTTYRGNFGAKLKDISFRLTSEPQIKTTPSTPVRRCSGVIDLSVSMNKNLIDAYNDFPLCDYSVYLHTPVSKELVRDVLSPLKQQIAGKNELESAGILLNFVQKGFDYKTDGQQFGRERPMFVDENFYYPYNDCEDRSMVYSMLIKELLGLDVILLEYPNHVATAVNFSTEVKGDFVTFEGKRFTVCDPTCINANVGVTMPQFRKTSPEAKRY